jgi:hypothetical protein
VTTTRYALLKDTNVTDIEPYLYNNFHGLHVNGTDVLIYGTDWAGFTLDAVLERLATGMHFGREVWLTDSKEA